MQDRLNEIFEMQKSFTEKFLNIKKNLKLHLIDKLSLLHLTKLYILSIIVLATLMLTTQQWKMHIKLLKINSNDNFLELAIDVLKYLMGILIIHGFTADDIYEKFVSKSNVVDAKFRQNLMLDSIKNDDKKIVFIDIDCVLADWASGYTQFINRLLNTHYESYKLFLDLYKFTKNRYEMKLKFRLSGEKRFLKMLPGASLLTNILNHMGFYVILITARPYNKYFRIYSDTLLWLVNNSIYYDGIIWNRLKEKYIIENFNKDKIQFVIDDQSDNIEKYLHAGFNCIQIKNTNSNFKLNIFKTNVFLRNDRIIYANSCLLIIDRFILEDK